MDRRLCDPALSELHDVEHLAAVECMGEGLAHRQRCQRGPLQVEGERHDAVGAARAGGRLDQCSLALEACHVRRRHAPEIVDLAVGQGRDLRGALGNHAEDQPVEFRQARLEVGSVANQHDALVAPVALETESAGADRAGVGLVAVGIGAGIEVAWQDRRLGHVELPQQRGVRALQPEDHGVRVGRLDRFDGGRETGARAGMEAEQHLLEGELHILGGERLAVVPRHARRQGEADFAPVLGNRPAGGEIGPHRAVAVEGHEAVEDRAGHRMDRTCGRDRRIEMAGIAAHRDDGRTAILGLRRDRRERQSRDECEECP